MSLVTTDLFEKALIAPLERADTLYVVSGYATAMMAMRHFEYAKRKGRNLAVRLIVGMCPQDGIETRNHTAFMELQTKKFDVNFKCEYLTQSPPVHSKVYAWFKDNEPVLGLIGSANYTQNAFSSSMREILSYEDPRKCLTYYNELLGEAANCADKNIPEMINIYEEQGRFNKEDAEAETAQTADAVGLEKITLTLLDSSTKETPLRSGINWGQRPDVKREPNQAYINIPAKIGRSGFFPDRHENFTVVTDDNKQLICVRAQDGGKGLHSTLDNSLLGVYFRFRLGLRNGEFVTKEHLLKYGRTDVDFYKIDNENYFMDFSVR